MATNVATSMLEQLGLEFVSCDELQSLWAGYGRICAVTAAQKNGEQLQLILKLVSPPCTIADEGHLRKVYSYEVERYFYQHVAPTIELPMAKCLSSTIAGDLLATLMTDLREEFPIAGEKRADLTASQVYSALQWLAKFHSSPVHLEPKSLVLPPLEEAEANRDPNSRTVWRNGGYTYLATRRKEYAALATSTSEWSRLCQPAGRSIAEMAANVMTPRGRSCEGLVHGDVKSENLFSSQDGNSVAFFDFQYVGMGLGVCDLAKLFTCSVPLDMLTKRVPLTLDTTSGEKRLLDVYREGFGEYADDFSRHWETALVDWCRFQASWGFWGNKEWLKARVRHILADQGWVTWLKTESVKYSP